MKRVRERGLRPHDRRSGGYCRNYELHPRVSPGCTSSEARTERYDADVPPRMTTREISEMKFRVDKEAHQIRLREESALKFLSLRYVL